MNQSEVTVLHQSLGPDLHPGVSKANPVLVLQSPSTVNLSEYETHFVDKSVSFREALYLSLINCLDSDDRTSGILRSLIAPVMSPLIDLAKIMDLLHSHAPQGEVNLCCDEFAGYIRMRQIKQYLDNANIKSRISLNGPGTQRFFLRYAVRRFTDVIKKRLRQRLASRQIRRLTSTKNQAIVFHGSARRIWQRLVPLVNSVPELNNDNLALVAAFSTKSVRGTPSEIAWNAVYSIDNFATPSEQLKPAKSLISALAENSELKASTKMLVRGAQKDLIEAMKLAYSIDSGLQNLCKDFKKVTFITSYGEAPTTAALCEFAKELPSIKIAMLPHGLSDPGRPEAVLQPPPDWILCWSEAMSKQVKASTNVRPLIVGSAIDEAIGANPESNLEKTTVLVAYGRPTTVLDIESYNVAVDIVKEAAKHRADLKFIIRRHPSDASNYWDERIAEMSSNVVESELKRIEEDLDRSFTVLTMHSTVGLEAICHGRAVLTIKPKDANSAVEPDFATCGASQIISSAKELMDALEELSNHWPA
ncbi:MAG: hypothetical protein AAF483_31330, partial [Planctomycetota bacterium]